MKKKYFTILLFIVTSVTFGQRFSNNTVVSGTDVEFDVFDFSGGLCSTSTIVRIVTPTLRKKAVLRPRFATAFESDEGYYFKVELFNELNQLVESKIAYPEQNINTDYNWYRTTVYFYNDPSVKISVKVTLVYCALFQIYVGGFPQEPKLNHMSIGSGQSALKTRCKPGPVNGKPNLEFSFINVSNSKSSYNVLNNDVGLLNRNQFVDINYTVKNSGNNPSLNTTLKLYLGSSADSYSKRTGEQLDDASLKALSSGASLTITKQLFITDFNTIGATNLTNGKQYYLFFILDEEPNLNIESNELDNIKSFKFTYSSSTGKILNPIGDCPDCIGYPQARVNPDVLLEENNTPYPIEVFDFYGRKITSGNVISVEEENQIISKLPKQLYIIKSKNGDRKVYY